MAQSYNLENLLHIMETLRSPDGCPWDQKQSFESILECLLEESYEYIDAVVGKDVANMKEELGDILLQVIFHSQMAKEQQLFDMKDVIQVLSEKLIRRHPHVFGGEKKPISDKGVEDIWERVKNQEKNKKITSSFFTAISKNLPSLIKAKKIQKKAGQVGFDWSNSQGSLDKIKEEIEELEKEIISKDFTKQEEELGDLLFSVVNLARKLNINPDVALHKANHKFTFRFEQMYQLILENNLNPKNLSLKEWDGYWEKVKEKE